MIYACIFSIILSPLTVIATLNTAIKYELSTHYPGLSTVYKTEHYTFKPALYLSDKHAYSYVKAKHFKNGFIRLGSLINHHTTDSYLKSVFTKKGLEGSITFNTFQLHTYLFPSFKSIQIKYPKYLLVYYDINPNLQLFSGQITLDTLIPEATVKLENKQFIHHDSIKGQSLGIHFLKSLISKPYLSTLIDIGFKKNKWKKIIPQKERPLKWVYRYSFYQTEYTQYFTTTNLSFITISNIFVKQNMSFSIKLKHYFSHPLNMYSFTYEQKIDAKLAFILNIINSSETPRTSLELRILMMY